jgi:hypothetical protein
MNHKILFQTPHSRKRANQRGISNQMISDTITYGELIYRQGLKFYIALKKNLNWIENPGYSELLENTVVVLTHHNEIITVYKNRYAIRSIKRKSKFLY